MTPSKVETWIEEIQKNLNDYEPEKIDIRHNLIQSLPIALELLRKYREALKYYQETRKISLFQSVTGSFKSDDVATRALEWVPEGMGK